jgi:hypothetical protein
MKLTQSQLRKLIKEELDREEAPLPFEEAKALAIKELKAAQAALTYALEWVVESTGAGTYWEETEELLDKLEYLMERFSREEPW